MQVGKGRLGQDLALGSHSRSSREALGGERLTGAAVCLGAGDVGLCVPQVGLRYKKNTDPQGQRSLTKERALRAQMEGWGLGVCRDPRPG